MRCSAPASSCPEAATRTDPPHSAEFLPLYEMLYECAERWLAPGGACAVMCGQMHLFEVLRLLTAYLEYWWIVAYLTPGGQAAQVFPRKVNTFWKPVVVLRKGLEKSEESTNSDPKSTLLASRLDQLARLSARW